MGIWAIFVKISKRCNLVFLKDNDERWNRIQQNLRSNLERASYHFRMTGDDQLQNMPTLAFIYDFVRLRSPDVGARLVKVRAECHMCAVLVTGLTMITIWNLGGIILSPTKGEIVVELGLLLSVVAFWVFMRDLEERFMTSLSNHWFILRSPVLSQGDDYSDDTRRQRESSEKES